MNRIKPLIGMLLVFGLSGCPATAAQAGESLPGHASLRIGIEKNRQPYAYMDDKQQAQGLLVTAITSACRHLQLNCQFVGGLFSELVRGVHGMKLNAVVVIDSALPPAVDALELTHPPAIDHLKLTDPLCRITPAFLQKKSDPARTQPETFKGTILGVQAGSVFHSYLASTYGHVARLKPYPLLESAVLDLVFDRVDAVLADEAFLKARVFASALADYADLTTLPLDKISLPTTTMALAVRERDTDLLKQLNGALTATGKARRCFELLATTPVEPSPK